MDRSVYPNKDVVKATRTVVAVYANKNTDHGGTEVERDGQKVHDCKAQAGLTCEAHVRVMQEVEGYFLKGQIRTPIHLLCKPDGAEFSRKDGKMAAKDLVAFLAAGVKQVGKGLAKDDYVALAGLLEKAKIAAGGGDLAAAAAAARDLKAHPALKGNETWTKRADEIAGYVNETGMERVNNAVATAEAGDPEQAKRWLKEVAEACAGLPCGQAAQEALEKLEKK